MSGFLDPENQKLLHTNNIGLVVGEGLLAVLVLLPLMHLYRWAKGRVLRRR